MVERIDAAARLALSRAERLAVTEGAGLARPLHLLWALTFDEGPAGQVLRGQGVLSMSPPSAATATNWSGDLAKVAEGALRVALRRKQGWDVRAVDLLVSVVTVADINVDAALKAVGTDPRAVVAAVQALDDGTADEEEAIAQGVARLAASFAPPGWIGPSRDV